MAAETAGSRILEAFAGLYPRAVFVEIGANDGVQHDPLRPFILSTAWSGVLVEPVPATFERLRANYRDLDGLSFENAAIGSADGTVPFYTVVDGPTWAEAVGSLSRAEVERTLAAAREFAARAKHEVPDLSSKIQRIDVPSLTLESLCRKHDIGRLDLLLVDAEGYDWEIVRGIDFERFRPRLLIFECNHLGEEDRLAAHAHVEGLGYEVMYEGLDTWCHDPRAEDELSRCWREVKPKAPSRLGMALHRVRTRLTPRRG